MGTGGFSRVDDAHKHTRTHVSRFPAGLSGGYTNTAPPDGREKPAAERGTMKKFFSKKFGRCRFRSGPLRRRRKKTHTQSVSRSVTTHFPPTCAQIARTHTHTHRGPIVKERTAENNQEGGGGRREGCVARGSRNSLLNQSTHTHTHTLIHNNVNKRCHRSGGSR